MKKVILSLVLTLSTLVIFSQKVKSQALNNYAPNEIIVKLKDDTNMGIIYRSRAKGIGQSTSQRDIGALLGISDKVKSTEVLFSEEFVLESIKLKKEQTERNQMLQKQNPNITVDPTEPNYQTLKNIFHIILEDKTADILELVNELEANDLVEFAEPNYRYHIDDFQIDSEIIQTPESGYEQENDPVNPNDPLFGQQQNIGQTNIDDVWSEYTTGNGSQVVAILDTGVDYTHPDLKDNIWINESELNGVEGYDDDGNGYIDDIRGWDFHHDTNTPLDDNMHGTHVAGIVGAAGNNGIGIAGVAWNIQLMPLKVFQASGIGDLSTIAKGIDYAVSNGATILNMSFGGGITSQTMYNSLASAYAGSKRFLVAAAGNNGLPLPPCFPSQIFYPAAYTFVFGVEAEGGFSNYDCDGPIFSVLIDQQNYETKAPGVSILSTVPNGGYRKLSGTSMSTPLVSGIVALYNEIRTDETNERKFGNLINTKTGTFIDALAAIKAEPQPILKLLTAKAIDSISTNTYQDGQLDAGEEIHLYPTVKNYWGRAENVKVELKFAGNEFSNEYYKGLIDITDSIIDLGTISDYAIYKQRENPLKFKISEDIAHNTQIEFRMVVWENNDPDSNERYASTSKIDSLDFKLKVKNGIKLQGLIEKDTVLTAKHEYIITNPLIIEGANLILKPGVTIRFGDDELTQQRGKILLYSKGNQYDPDGNYKNAGIIAIGTKDSLITFKPDTYNNSYVELSYDNNGRNGTYDNDSECDWCVFERMHVVYAPLITNSQFFDAGAYGGRIENSNFVQSDGYLYSISGWKHSNLVDFSSNGWQNIYYNPTELNILGWYRTDYNYIGNYSEIALNGFYANRNQEFEKIYLGTGSIDVLKELNIDAFDGNAAGFFRYNNPRLTPYSEAPAIVWKVEVNGKNAWDDYDSMDPLGVGTHEFKVYFNRPVDTLVNPTIGYGVRDPWNTNLVSEQGSWNDEGTIYTVNHEIGILSTDGINRINVWGGKDLNGWDIPVEKRRFNILIQSAGSASTGFAATPGLGEISLDWNPPSDFELDDVLGYNMYRYVSDGEGGFTDPVKVNENLITDVTFKDFDVVRDTQYFYKYKILRTSFEETDYSNAVSASLLTAALGDSNGDAAVNVLDVVNTVNYILGTNPTPFIDYATDVNNDSAINVLDIVAIVDLILNASTSNVRVGGAPINYYPNKAKAKAKLYWDGKDLIIDTPKAIAGLQLAYNTAQNYELGALLQGFESLSFTQDDQQRLMLYNMSQNVIPSGKHVLLSLTSGEPFEVINAIAGEVNGTPITLSYNENDMEEVMDAPYQPEELQIASYSPNPTYGEVQVKYYLPKAMSGLAILIYDAQGNLILNHNQLENSPGYHLTSFDLSKNKSGIYFMIITGYNQDARRYIDQAKIILK